MKTKIDSNSGRAGVAVDALVRLIRKWKRREKKYRDAVRSEWESGDKYASRRYEGESIGTRWAIEDLEELISSLPNTKATHTGPEGAGDSKEKL